MMRRSALKPSTIALKGADFLRSHRKEQRESGKIVRQLKSKGMVGRTPTADEQRFMDAMGALPCLACLKDGRENSLISLHHILGRTAPGAHYLVLPLCAPHHQQDDTDPLKRLSIHGRKATFETKYGTQMELLAEAKLMLGVV